MEIPETITRVFTKYDDIIHRIDIPGSWMQYYPVEIESGLEGVTFVNYKRGSRDNKGNVFVGNTVTGNADDGIWI